MYYIVYVIIHVCIHVQAYNSYDVIMYMISYDVITFTQVLGTHYLELYSDKAQVETDKAIAVEFLNEGQ